MAQPEFPHSALNPCSPVCTICATLRPPEREISAADRAEAVSRLVADLSNLRTKFDEQGLELDAEAKRAERAEYTQAAMVGALKNMKVFARDVPERMREINSALSGSAGMEVAAELTRLRAENERLTTELQGVKNNRDHYKEVFEGSCEQVAAMCELLGSKGSEYVNDVWRLRELIDKMVGEHTATTEIVRERDEWKGRTEFFIEVAGEVSVDLSRDHRSTGPMIQKLQRAVSIVSSEENRCLITTNICGTDTWKVGSPCPCAACQRYLRSKPADPRWPLFDAVKVQAIADDIRSNLIGNLYQHYSNLKFYRVSNVVVDKRNGQAMVCYYTTNHKDEQECWTQPYSTFSAMVDRNGESVPRFRKL